MFLKTYIVYEFLLIIFYEYYLFIKWRETMGTKKLKIS